ncbi:MAG: helicase-associated domain-containing protein [bacterium]
MLREPKREGALSPEEFMKLLESDYDPSTKRLIAAAIGGTDSDLKNLTERLFGDDVAARYDELSGVARHALFYVVAQGGGVRGENLRREMLLDGYGDTTDVLADLVNKSLFIVLPNPGEVLLDVPRLIEQGTVLQRDLTIGAHIVQKFKETSATVLAEESEEIEDVTRITSSSTETLELNLLHVATKILHTPLKLNRDGTPHRRGLAKLAREVVFPDAVNEAGPDVDVNEPRVLDYMVFVLAMALQLGLLHIEGEYLEGVQTAIDGFFSSGLSKRNRTLGDAFKGLRQWNEADSFTAEKIEDVNSSLSSLRGEGLIGARGYVFSILRRARFSTWKREEAVESLCALMDPPFLKQSLKNAENDPTEWVRAFLQRGLYWLGALERGMEGNAAVIRFTTRGREMLGLPVKDAPKPTDKSMVVQPNFEIMVFLDATDISTLHQVYQVSERVKLSDRVAVFKLTPESVQRGYSMGSKAAAVIAFLRDQAAVEVPESVIFQLHDWERIHKRLVVHHGGYLVRSHDPDALDLWLGQVKHDSGCVVVRLGPSTAYLNNNDEPILTKLLARANGTVVHIDSPVPVLRFDGPLLITVDPVDADIITMWELARIAHEVEDAPARMRQFSLDLELLKRRWPTNTLQNTVEFLEPRTFDGVPASQRILLQSLLESAPSAKVQSHVTLIRLQDEFTADLFSRVHEFDAYVVERLGPLAFAVDAVKVDELRERMIELGFVI